MANIKPEEKKKEKLSLTIDKKLVEKMDQYLTDEQINNRSRYIENLVREDMEKKGKNIDRIF
jgi:metal-responsive CopG/Arc/MetJ family transcriptional regulator